MAVNSKLSISNAAKQWGVSRQTIYKRISDGTLSKNHDGTIDAAEMIRVYGGKQSTVNHESQPIDNERHNIDIFQAEIVNLTKQLDKQQLEIDSFKSRESWLLQQIEWYKHQIELLQPKRLEHKEKKSFLARFF